MKRTIGLLAVCQALMMTSQALVVTTSALVGLALAPNHSLATLPYALALAGNGWRKACANDPALKRGLNVVDGRVTHPGVASAFDLELDDVDALIERGPMGAHTTAANRF